MNILINSAGIFPFGATGSIDEATMDAVYALNVKAPWFLVAALAPAMAGWGAGAVVNVALLRWRYSVTLTGSSGTGVDVLSLAPQ